MKKEVSTGMVVGIILIVVVLVAGIGYTMFFNKNVGAVSSASGEAKTREYAAKQAEMMKQQSQTQGGGGSSQDNQAEMMKRMSHQQSGH